MNTQTIPTGFSVIWRNYGHWDIVAGGGRLFRIRGNPGSFKVMDERSAPYPTRYFKTVGACIGFITDELMFENLKPSDSNDGNNQPITP